MASFTETYLRETTAIVEALDRGDLRSRDASPADLFQYAGHRVTHGLH